MPRRSDHAPPGSYERKRAPDHTGAGVGAGPRFELGSLGYEPSHLTVGTPRSADAIKTRPRGWGNNIAAF